MSDFNYHYRYSKDIVTRQPHGGRKPDLLGIRVHPSGGITLSITDGDSETFAIANVNNPEEIAQALLEAAAANKGTLHESVTHLVDVAGA